jgi:L-malate glycosyltransferase
MTARSNSTNGQRRVLLIGPKAPPSGGMALQAQALERLLRTEGNSVDYFPSNIPFPASLHFLDRIRVLRPLARSAVIWIKLWKKVPQADVVHVLAASWLYFFLVVGPAVILSRLHRKRVVVNYRSGEGRQFFQKYGWLAKPLFQLADEITAPSEFLAHAIRERFGLPVSIVPNIVDLSVFRYSDRTTFRPKFLVTRHLERIYDVESVLRAFRLIQASHPEASLHIAGTVSQEKRLRGLVDEWRLRNVCFLGNAVHQDMPAIYDRCDILLNGTRVDNFPASLLEASASGLPVVSTNAGGIPFIYEDGKNAILVDPGDWQGLAAGVERLLNSPSLARQLAAEAAHLCRQCEWQNVRRLLYRSYDFDVPEL